VVQVDAFSRGLREATTTALLDLAEQCDGVRCDMAMLLLSEVFASTWGERAGRAPTTEYWEDVIGPVRAGHPHFLFIAEAYWDFEERMLDVGFDYSYDKPLYDHLVQDGAQAVRSHLRSTETREGRLLRFIENHDEIRAAEAFPPAKGRAAALTVLTLPGAVLLHHGQAEGRQVRVPVFLDRGPDEPVDDEVAAFYAGLLKVLAECGLRRGEWTRCPVTGWSDNGSFIDLLAWSWQPAAGSFRTTAVGPRQCSTATAVTSPAVTQPSDASAEPLCHLIVVNYSAHPSQGMVVMSREDLAGKDWRLADPLDGREFVRQGDGLLDPGLFVDLEPWSYHFFALERS
jgi:hypothetical protein